MDWCIPNMYDNIDRYIIYWLTERMKGYVVTSILVCISVLPNTFPDSDMCVHAFVCLCMCVCACICIYKHLYTLVCVCVYLCLDLHTANLCVDIPAGLCWIDWARSAWVSSQGKIEAARCGGPGLPRISLLRACSRPKREPPSGVSSRWTPVCGAGEDTS